MDTCSYDPSSVHATRQVTYQHQYTSVLVLVRRMFVVTTCWFLDVWQFLRMSTNGTETLCL